MGGHFLCLTVGNNLTSRCFPSPSVCYSAKQSISGNFSCWILLHRDACSAQCCPRMLLTPLCCFCLQVMGSVTVGSASATRVTSGTTATAPLRRMAASPATGRCAAAGAPAPVGSASALSLGLLEIHVRSVPPAQVSAALKGTHEGLRRDFWLVGRADL